MTASALRRHDISDRTWELLEAHLPGQKGTWGGIAKDNRLFINAVFWILKTGHRGGICPRITGIGRIHTDGSFAGETSEYGRNCWNNW